MTIKSEKISGTAFNQYEESKFREINSDEVLVIVRHW